MPPKRKATTQDKPASLRRKTKSLKTSKDVVSKPEKFRQTYFEKYKDEDSPNIIGPDGCQAFFSDIGVSLESIAPILIAWKMGSSRMGYITRDEWDRCMKEWNIDSVPKLKAALSELQSAVENDSNMFKQVYLFTFTYAKSVDQKSMDIETSMALWQVLLDSYPLVKSFVKFLEEKRPVKVINKDQWANMLDLCRSMAEDLSGYDTSSSWPVLFDEFAEWKKESL